MGTIHTQTAARNSLPLSEDDNRREHLLAALRAASADLLKAKLDLDNVGTALKGGLITSGRALSWIDDLGATCLLQIELERSKSC